VSGPLDPVAEDYRRLVERLSGNPSVIENLLTTHEPASDGKCRTCVRDGSGERLLDWPCPVARLALHARERRLSR
jgi:hypothetical protein